jgi:hypothetical protein
LDKITEEIMIRLLWIWLFDSGLWEYLTYEAERQDISRFKVLKAELEAEQWLRENPLSNDELVKLVENSKELWYLETTPNGEDNYPF